MIHLDTVSVVEKGSTEIYRYNACRNDQENRYESQRYVVPKKIK
jgi:hypothetical protein